MQATWVNWNFANCHGLQGILIAEILNFNWPRENDNNENSFVDPYILGFLQ